MAALRPWIGMVAGGAAAVALTITAYHRVSHGRSIGSVTGVVLVDAADPGKQFPVENATVTVLPPSGSRGPAETARSNAAGLFHLSLHDVYAGDMISLQLRSADCRPLNLIQPAASKLYVIRMMSDASAATILPTALVATLSNLRVRFAVRSEATVNVGSAVKVFQVMNTGNLPCDHSGACSPDGKWKAAVGGASLDAGEGNEFREPRVSCIAGPCPFSSITRDGFSGGGQTISVSVETWSDTVTFLMEAEVTRTMVSDAILQSFPAISDTSMDFTLPPTGEGPSIEAEVNGSEVVFPLGPKLDLSWATCHVTVTTNRNKLYHCDLKPGYRFKRGELPFPANSR